MAFCGVGGDCLCRSERWCAQSGDIRVSANRTGYCRAGHLAPACRRHRRIPQGQSAGFSTRTGANQRFEAFHTTRSPGKETAMKSRSITIALLLSAAALLSGCDTYRSVADWFDLGTKKVRIQGERISIIASDAQLTPDPQLASSKMDLPPPKKNADWPEPGGSADNVMGNLMADGPLEQLWSVPAGKGTDDDSRLTAPPIVANGKIYVLDADTHVFAFDAKTGDQLWDVGLAPDTTIGKSSWFGLFGPDRVDPRKGFGGGLAYDGGRLFAATGFGNVIALDAENGQELWKVETTVPVRSAPVVVDGRVYVVTQENQTQALDATDGHQLWDHHGTVESAGVLSSASVAVSGDTVVVPYSSGELFALRAQNGTPAWNDTLTRT